MAAIAHPAPVPGTRRRTRVRHPLRRGPFGLLVIVIAVWSLFPFPFPQISIVTPLYQILISLHLIDTYPGLSGIYIGLSRR